MKHYEQMCIVCSSDDHGACVSLIKMNNGVNTLELQFIKKEFMVEKQPDIAIDMINRNQIGL